MINRNDINRSFTRRGHRRHIYRFSQPILAALSQVIPEQVIANGSAGLWNTMLNGRLADDSPFAYIYFSAGGMGAGHNRDGLSATAFPSGIMGVPVEAIETAAPVLMHRRELRQDSGGAGEFRGGLGQEMALEVITGLPATHSCMYDRTTYPAEGINGGGHGAVGEVILSNGTHPHPKSRYTLQSGQHVILRLPGGGGFNSPLLRDPKRVLEDVRQGYVSLEAAKDLYGVIIDSETETIDEKATTQQRALLKSKGAADGAGGVGGVPPLSFPHNTPGTKPDKEGFIGEER